MAGRKENKSRLELVPERPPEEINRGDLALFSQAGLGLQPVCLQSLDELLERDRNREDDGFPARYVSAA